MKTIIRNEVLHSEAVAIADNLGNRITYKELAEEADYMRERFKERSLIFFLCDYHIETVSLLYKILYLNQVPLLLPADIDEKLLDGLVSIYQPQYLYCSKDKGYCDRYCHLFDTERHTWLQISDRKCLLHPDVALLLSTSGTTGNSKLVKLSYQNLYSAGEYACSDMEIVCGQKGLCPSPMNHILGIIFCIWHWHCGATVLITEEFVISNKFREFFEAEKVNNFGATPYIYHMLQRVAFWNSEKLSYLHWAISAGEQVPEALRKALAAIMGERFWIAYGQTETSGFISAIHFTQNDKRENSVGRSLRNIEVWTDSDSGELLVKSGSVCMGYAVNREQLAEGDMNQGMLRTGDIVSIDEDGYIYLKGRLARCVKILGKRISLEDIEKFLGKQFPDVQFACNGSDGKISVFYAETEADLEGEIKELLDCGLKIPDKFVACRHRDRIPRNSAGKVMYEELKD